MERLEERMLLTVSATFVSGELEINLDSGDNVSVRENPVLLGNVQVLANGSPLASLGTVPAASVSKLLIHGGDEANVIDLTGMTAAVFTNPALVINVDGGNGEDTLLGSGSLAASLNGGHGDDSIVGGGLADTLVGDDGQDSINGGAGNDSINAGDGQDTVDGGIGDDTILGGDGQDSIDGGVGNDNITSDDGSDTVNGGDGNDTLNGMAGADSIDGQNGNDSILGGAGDDTLLGGSGADIADGQAGNDLEFAEAATGQAVTALISTTAFFTNFDNGVPTQLSGTTTTVPVQGYAGIGTGANIFGGNLLQNATGGNSVPQTPSTLTLTNLPTHTSVDINFLLAIINSWGGPTGALSVDFLNIRVDGVTFFRNGFDNQVGGTNQTYFPPVGVQLTPLPLVELGFPTTAPSPDSAWNIGLDPQFNNIPHTASTLMISFFADGVGFEGATNENFGIDNLEVILNGVPNTILSNDTLLGGAGNDTLNGADGNDLLNGQGENDSLLGNAGNDSLLGGAGNDEVYGDSNLALSFGTGNDTMFGNAGTDTLIGGGGIDLMDGGAGNDVVRSIIDISNVVSISIDNPANVIEGATGQTSNVIFTVTLNFASVQTVTVLFATADGSAVGTGPTADYTPVNGTLTFAPGVTSAQITVPILGDGIVETDENFFVRLTNATNALIADFEGETFIVNDDGWAAAGPAPVTNGQVTNIVPNDEISGAVQGLATHPTNPDIAYVGTVQGGVWKTLNATAVSPTWVPQTDFLSSLSIGDIEFDPTDATGNTLVAGIGRTSSFAATGGNQTGLLRTTNGGTSWTELNAATIQNQTFRSVAARGNIIMGASDTRWSGGGGAGLFRSTDSGATFTQVSGSSGLPNGPVSDLVGDATNPSRFYIAVRQTGVFRSDDSGATWVNVTNNLTGINNATTAVFLSVHATGTNNAVYAGVVDGNGNFGGLFRSANAGGNWTALDTPTVFNGQQGAVHGAIAADPTNPNLVYAAGDRIQNGPFTVAVVRIDATQPAGSQETTITGAGAQNTAPHADSRRLVFTADGNLLLGCDGGIYRRANPTGNAPWTSMNSNLQTLEAHDVDYDTNSNIITATAQDNGTNEQTATGSLTWRQTFGGDGGDVAVDVLQLAAQNRSIRYASAQNLGGFHSDVYDVNNVFISRAFPALAVQGNGAAIVPQFITPIAIDAVAGNRLIIGAANAVYESLDGGQTVNVIGAGIGVNANGASALAYGGTLAGTPNPEVVYVGSGNQVFVRSVAGAQLAATAAVYPGGFVSDIVLDPTNWQNAYVVSQSGVFMTTNGGGAWINVTGNLVTTQMRTIEFIGGATPAVVVGTLQGVFRMAVSVPGVWAEFGATSLPNVAVWELRYDPADDVLLAGTMGRGVWLFAMASAGQQVNNPVPGSGGTAAFVDAGDTLLGRDGDDLLVGNSGNDVINGEGGNDTLLGGGGNDSILGGSGQDSLDGQAGNDTLRGQGGRDTIIGGDGDDVFEWDATIDGVDQVNNSSGSDQVSIFTGAASDSVTVAKSGAILQVTSGGNQLTINPTIRIVNIDTGDGNDTITVGDLNGVLPTVLTINGGLGNDTINASAATLGMVRMQLNGNDGNDSITGSKSDDTIDGGAGLDTMNGGSGNDTIRGGTENDNINGGAGDDSIEGNDGNDALVGGAGNDAIVGGLGNDLVSGNSGNDTLLGNDGRDTLNGGSDNDSLDGGVGKDTLTGADGNDTLDGGRNDDIITGDAGDDSIRGNHGNDTVDGGLGADTINGGDGNDSINGGDGNDLIAGGDGNDFINAGEGNDLVTGGDGKDTIFGGGGNDGLLGDDGDDTINGQSGTNTLAGGQGVDVLIGAVSEIDESFVLANDLLVKLGLL